MRLALAMLKLCLSSPRRAKEEIEFINVGIINFAKIPPFLAFFRRAFISPQDGFLAAFYYFYHFFTILSSGFLT